MDNSPVEQVRYSNSALLARRANVRLPCLRIPPPPAAAAAEGSPASTSPAASPELEPVTPPSPVKDFLEKVVRDRWLESNPGREFPCVEPTFATRADASCDDVLVLGWEAHVLANLYYDALNAGEPLDEPMARLRALCAVATCFVSRRNFDDTVSGAVLYYLRTRLHWGPRTGERADALAALDMEGVPAAHVDGMPDYWSISRERYDGVVCSHPVAVPPDAEDLDLHEKAGRVTVRSIWYEQLSAVAAEAREDEVQQMLCEVHSRYHAGGLAAIKDGAWEPEPRFRNYCRYDAGGLAAIASAPRPPVSCRTLWTSVLARPPIRSARASRGDNNAFINGSGETDLE